MVTNFQSWKDLAEKFNNQLSKCESSSKDDLQKVVEQLERWRREFERVVRYGVVVRQTYFHLELQVRLNRIFHELTCTAEAN